MPIFEYSCKDCGAQFEEVIFSDSDDVVCEKCGSKNTAKLMSCCGFKTGGAPASADAGSASGGTSVEASSGPQYRGRGSGCAGCSGGNCSTCG